MIAIFTWNVSISFLYDAQVENTEWAVDNATMHRFPSPVSLAATAKLCRTLLEKQLDTSIGEDPLSHGEPLLVISTSDPKHVALETRKRSHKRSCKTVLLRTFHSSPKKPASSSCDIRFSKNGLLIGYTQWVQCSEHTSKRTAILHDSHFQLVLYID